MSTQLGVPSLGRFVLTKHTNLWACLSLYKQLDHL